MTDFEAAIKAAATQVFSAVTVLGDSFHFIHNNIKFMMKHEGKEHTKALADDLKQLYAQTTYEEFKSMLAAFRKKWSDIHPGYDAYFENTWIKRYPPAGWAFFGRGHSYPSGDQAIEAWHRRLKSKKTTSQAVRLDKFVYQLLDESTYYDRILQSPDALIPLQNEISARRNNLSKKRITLESIIGNPKKKQALIQQGDFGK